MKQHTILLSNSLSFKFFTLYYLFKALSQFAIMLKMWHFKVNSTLHMVGTMDNSYRPHPTCQAKEMGTLTDWEVVEGPQIRVEGEVLQVGHNKGRFTSAITTGGWWHSISWLGGVLVLWWQHGCNSYNSIDVLLL